MLELTLTIPRVVVWNNKLSTKRAVYLFILVIHISRFIAFYWATIYVSEIVFDSCTENSVGHIGLPSTLYQGLPEEISANQINTSISPYHYSQFIVQIKNSLFLKNLTSLAILGNN